MRPRELVEAGIEGGAEIVGLHCPADLCGHMFWVYVDEEVRFCPYCGADLHRWAEVLGEASSRREEG